MNAACTNRNEAVGGVSFAAWIRSRFSDQLHAELTRRAALRNIELSKAVLTEVIVTGTERDIVYANVYFDCTIKESGCVGQIATAGLGITLTAADTMVFYSLDYSMSNFEQAKARIHRVGQRNPCTYLYLVAAGTVDEKVLQALRDKADLARVLIDDFRAGRNPFQTD